ncbi:MAG: STAS domain-containing protein [Bacteroidota bacterium]
MDLKETKVDNISIYSISGKLDASNADEFQEKMVSAAKAGQDRFVFNMEGLDYISSSGLRAFLAISKAIPGSGFVRFYNIKDQVLEVFTISGFNTIFQIFEDRDDALML